MHILRGGVNDDYDLSLRVTLGIFAVKSEESVVEITDPYGRVENLSDIERMEISL